MCSICVPIQIYVGTLNQLEYENNIIYCETADIPGNYFSKKSVHGVPIWFGGFDIFNEIILSCEYNVYIKVYSLVLNSHFSAGLSFIEYRTEEEK